MKYRIVNQWKTWLWKQDVHGSVHLEIRTEVIPERDAFKQMQKRSSTKLCHTSSEPSERHNPRETENWELERTAQWGLGDRAALFCIMKSRPSETDKGWMPWNSRDSAGGENQWSLWLKILIQWVLCSFIWQCLFRSVPLPEIPGPFFTFSQVHLQHI